MFKPNGLTKKLKMKKSIIILVFVFVLSQLGNAASTMENVSPITGITELPKPDVEINTINLKNDVEENKKPVVLLVPVESSEEIYDSHDEEQEEEGKEETTEKVEDVTHHNHKTKRCKSLNSFRTARRIPVAKVSRKYISASTESSIDESVENPIGGTSLFRVASVKDAKKILKNLLKSRSTKREDDVSSERVSKSQKQDSIKLVSKGSDRQGHKPKKYVCYCVEEDCDMKRPVKKPSRTYAVKKKIGTNILSKSSTNYEGQEIRDPGLLHHEDVLGSPNNLHCPPGAILMEELEYLAQLAASKRQKHNYRNRPVKNCPETIFPPDSEARSLGQPTKIHIPLGGNRKWNRRVYKVDGRAPFAQKLQSVFEQKETQDGIPCPEPESTYNEQQGLQDYYENEQNNYNQYNQMPVAPNPVYPPPYAVYPQYPQYPQYGEGYHDQIPMEPPQQDFISRQEPLLNQYMPTPLGRNFMDINQCIKLFGRNFCIITTTTIAPIPGPHYTNNCGEHEEPGMVAQWQEDTHYTTKMPQVKTSKYPVTVYNADEDTTHYYGLGVTRYHEENQHGAEKYPEDDAEREYGGRISSGFEYDRVTTSPYYSKPITVKIQSNDGTSRPSSYEIIGSEHEEHDYGDYDNFVGPESPIRHGSTNSEYLVPMEDSYDSESADYLGSSEETNENNVLQKISEENVTKGPIIAITKNLQGAHRISSPQYVQYTVTPVKGYSTSSSEDTSDETLEDTSGYIQTTQDSRLSDYDSSEIRYSTSKPDKDESIFSTIGRPEDESRTTLLMESQNKNELPSWQRVTTMYPIFDNEDHESNHQNDVHPSAESDQAGANFELHTPKTTNSHRQFVGITQSTPVDHHSETEYISGTDTGGNNYYGSSHAPEDKAEDATTSLLALNEPEEPTTSTTYSEINNAEEIETDEDSPQEIEEDEENNNESVPTTLHYTTESRLGDTVHKYSTTKIHPYLQTKQAESNSDAASAETTTSYEKLVGKSQSTPMDNLEKPEFVSEVTVDGDNQYTTSTVNSKHGTTPLLRANEPEEQDVSSEEMNAEVTSSLNTSESGNDDTENTKYITTEKIFYPQAGSYETTLIDSSTEPEQVGDSFQTTSHQPYVESIPQSTSSNSFGEAEDISNEASSYTTMENSKYDTTPLLGANELEKNVFTSYSHYLTTPTDENKPGSLLQQVPEEHDEVGTEEIPSTVHYIQNSEMAGMDQNKWTTAEEVTNSHPQFVGTIQSAPVTDFSQPEEVSPTKIGGKNYYTTSYATMKGTDNSKTAILKAKEPEEEVFGSTTNSWPQENEEKNQDNIEKTTWTQYYPTQSEIQKTSMDQLSTTDQYSHPQFVGSHQSTLVDSSTRQDQLEENFGAHETNTNQPFVESIGHSTSLSDFPKTEDISDDEISHVTMANSRYDSTSSLEAIEPEESEFTFYSRYPTTIKTEEDTNVPLWQQETEEHDEDTTEKIPLSDYYITQSNNSGGDRNKWSNAGKTTSSRGQYVGVTQSTPNDDFLQNKDTSTTTYGTNSYYSTSYATMENMDDSTSTGLGEKEPEEEIFRSTIYPTVQEKHQDNIDDTTWPQYYQTQSEIPETSIDQHFTTGKNSYPQFVGLHQSTVVDSSTVRGQLRENYNTLHKASSHQPFLGKISQSKTDFATTEDISDASTSYATMENSRYDTTPLLGETEPEENDFSSYSSYSTTIEPEADTTAWLKNAEERVGGKVTSSHPQFVEETRSTPVDYFSQPAVTSSSAIGGNSHYTTSYATMENSEYDTTPLLSATNPEEKDFTTYLPHSTAIEYKTDTTSPRLENTRKQNGVSTQKIPPRHYATHTVMAGMNNNKLMKSGKTTTLGSHPQFVGITQSTPADDFSQSGVASSSTIGSNSHYTISYATVDDMHHSKTTLLGAQEPEEEIFRPTTYPTIHHAEEMKTPSSWQQENTHDYQNNLEETTWNQYPTQSEVQDTTRGQHIATEENFYPQVGKSHQSTNEVLSSTGSNTEQYFTTGRNSHHQFSTEVPEDITFANNAEQSTSWYHSTGQQEATSQSDHRQFVGSHHSTTSPRFRSNSGIMEETNAYFTSKAYDDNINAVTGPDSYFEGGGLKNWNDFTSMSSDDFTIGNAIGAEEVKQPTTGDAFGPENEGWETTRSSQRQSTDYNVVGEEMFYKESTMNDEVSQDTTEDDYSAGHTIKTTNDNSHILYPGQRYKNTLLTSTGKITGEEDVGKPIYESDSSSPIADTHFFESHTGHPNILKSENKILETTSLENLGIDYTASSGKSTFSEERITQPNMKEIPFFDQSTNSYERKSNTIDDKSSPENEADEKALISHENISPSKDYDYTNDYITLDKSPTTEFSKDHEDASLQVLGNTLRNEPSLNQEVTASSINYGDNMSSEDDLSSISSESETVSNLSRSSTTTKSVNYEDYSDSSSTQEHEWHQNYIEEETAPTIDSSEEILSEDQLSPEERKILRSTVEKVVNDLISAKSDKPDKDGHIPPEVVGAPLLPGLPEMSILKNLFSLPEVKNMAIGTVKGLMSEISGVPQTSSLGRLADHLIDSVLDGVINNILPGPITSTSSAIVDEHRYENGQWTVVPVTLVPKVNSSGQKPVDEVLSTTKHIVGEEPDDNVLGTTKDIVGQEPEDKVLSTIKDIVGRPGIGLQGARLPLVQNIIVRAVENSLRNAKNVVNHSVIWDTLNEVIARAEKSLLPSHGTTTTIKSTTTAKTTSKSLGVKKPGGPFKIAPVIPVTEHVFKDGKWDEKQTVLGAKKKNFGSSTSTISATDNQLRTSSSSYETSEELDNQYDYTTKALDYALLGESEEDNEEQKYGTTGFVGITKEIPKNIKTLHDDEDDLDDSPIKYYSPKDRILSYKKNHQTPAGFVESQQKWQTTSGSLNNAPTEDYSTSTETASNELTENTESSAEFALVNQADDSVGSSEESTICTCAERKKMKNQQKVGSALRGSTEASTEEDNYFESTSTVYDSDERENSESSNYGEGNSLTTLQPRKKSGEELNSTESSEFSSTIHHLDVDQDESNDDTTEENVANENPSVTEELGRNTVEDSQENLEEVETDSNESISISNTKEHTNNMINQITSTPVYVYGEPVERNKFSEDSSTNDGQTVESTDEEFIGEANVITTEHVDQTSDEASDKIMDRNGTPTISDVTEQNLRADDHKHNDQHETTPVYVYGTPVNQISSEKTTNWDESETQNLRQQFSEAPDHHDFTHGTTASILTGSQEKIGNPQFSGIRTIESHSNTESDRQLEEYSTEEYTKMENTLTTDNSRENSRDKVTTEAAKSNESFSDVTNKVLQGGSKNGSNDFSTRVYVNGEPIQETSTELLREIGDNQFQGLQTTESHSNTGSDGQPEEYVNMENTLTTDNSGENSGDEVATEAAKSNESFSDVTDKVLQGGSKNGVNDFSTHVYVNGEPIQETTTELLREIGDNQFQGLQTTESRSDTGSDGQPDEYSTEESIKMANTLTSDNSNENPVDEVPTEAAKSNESFSDVTNEVLQAGNKNVASDFSTQVYVNGEPLQKTTKQLSRKHPVTLKSYISPQEATTSSQGLIGAAKSRNGRPGLPSPPRNDLERPRDDILKDSRTSSGGASNCMTPKYDPTYFGKISLNGVNPGGDSISTLMNSDLFYVGDGVRIPLTIQRMPDGSFALSISEKICENFVSRKCPCCVPREGDIVEEKRQSNEPEEYNAETSSKEDYNYDSFEPTESAEFHGKSKKRYVRSTSGSEVMVTSATPVKNFVKKYNLTLNLGKNHSPTLIRNNDEDAEEIRNSRRKSRLSSSRDTKLGNLYGNNNEIQRDDSEEIGNRIIDASDSDTVSKESNLVRKAEYVFDTDTNDFIQSLLHIKDAPEDKRTEIVLNALDGLVNARENSGSMDRSYFGEPAQEIPSNQNPLFGSDEYDLNEMENEMARYGYQKDNPILERIRFIKAQQNSHGQYKYQKNIDHRAKGKMNILKTVLQWLKQVFLETNVNNKN